MLHPGPPLLVPEHDVAGMAEAMLRLIEDPRLAGQLGEAARDHVRTHFSMEQSIDRLWRIIAPCFDDLRAPVHQPHGSHA